MHEIEPYFNWRHLYTAEEDNLSPFFGRQYSEFQFTQTVYNYYIHPQWDDFGSQTMYLKILFADYEMSFAIIEFIGEWNDAIENDIMTLRRDVTDILYAKGINKFILVAENVLNFHSSDDSYYEEWYNDIEDGWVALVNFREHVLEEFKQHRIDYYLNFGGELDNLLWRKFTPLQMFKKVDEIIQHRLG